jgi:two-component system, LytTR family, sensor kinase
MIANGQQLASGKLYWRLQLGGWLAFGLVQLSPFLLYNNGKARPLQLLSPVILKLVLGLAGTHVLHLCIRARQWLQMAGSHLTLRLLSAIALLGAILAGVEALGHTFLPHDAMVRPGDPRRILLSWIGWMIVLSLWTTLYMTIHEFRNRRAREMRSLRLEMMVQEAQLRGLRAQLNPHFLFNCLNDLREVIAEDPERAQLMVTQLSALLRYSLQSNQSVTVPLADEIHAVEDYLALEEIRFEERLRVRWSVADGACGARVPPMLLQTLVENALKHGIAQRPQGGEVAIHARLAGSDLELEVINSGEIDGHSSPDAVGLKNAQAMIKLLYGERANLVLENASDGQVRALVRMPVAPAEVTK